MKIALTHNLQRSDSVEEAEFDSPETIAAITEGLVALGHTVTPVDVAVPVEQLVSTLRAIAPDLVFNTAEGTSSRNREAFYPGLFEQLGLPWTGSDAYTCTITLDKQLTRMLVASAGVPVARGQLVRRASDALDPELRMPVIIKPNAEGSSRGITERSIVETREELEARVAEMIDDYEGGLLIEEFIDGRDVVVPWLELASPDTGGVLAAAEYRFDPAVVAKRRYTIYDYSLKHEQSDAVSVSVPAELTDDVATRIQELTRRAIAALDIRDLGRLDFRVRDDGEIIFIEANALPSLEPGASIYEAAALAGLTTLSSVLEAVVRSAVKRHDIAPKHTTRGRARSGKRVGLVYNLKRVKPTADSDSDAEFDSQETIDAIAGAIRQLGHEAIPLEANTTLLTRLESANLDVAFNIAEGYRGRGRESLVPALLEMLDIPYTGSDPTTMAITLDKQLAKHIVHQAGVATPSSVVLTSAAQRLPAGFAFPAILKPVAEGSSKGVDSASVVEDEATLRERLGLLLERYRQGLLLETFVGGREFTVGLLGAARPRVLPPMEIVFADPDVAHPIYTFEHKQAFTDAVRYEAPAKLDPALERALIRAARASWRALGCRDVARIDLRLDAEGRPNFIECNPLPGLSPGWSDLCLIATSAGMSYTELIGAILEPALRRRHTQERLRHG